MTASQESQADQVGKSNQASQASQTASPVLWFTGLSGSGKTTTAKLVQAKLCEQGRPVELLDGDELRATVCKGLGFSRVDRNENIQRMAYIAKLLSRNGVMVVVAAITPYREMREYLRKELPGYIEIYVQSPLELCEARDVKGLYAKARRGEISSFTGITDPYEEPVHPDIILDTSTSSAEQNCQAVLLQINLL